MTGYFKRLFVNMTPTNGKVANFFIKGDGYHDPDEDRYVNKEFAFETWLPELIRKLEQTPKETLITVHFNIFPKRLTIEGKSYNQNALKATRITRWERTRKEIVDEDETLYQMEIRLTPSNTE